MSFLCSTSWAMDEVFYGINVTKRNLHTLYVRRPGDISKMEA